MVTWVDHIWMSTTLNLAAIFYFFLVTSSLDFSQNFRFIRPPDPLVADWDTFIVFDIKDSLIKSNPRDLWILRHLIRVMRRHDLTQKDNCKDNFGDLWHVRHWLQFWQLRTWIRDNHFKFICEESFFLTKLVDNFPRLCLFGSGHVFSSLWSNVSKVTSL